MISITVSAKLDPSEIASLFQDVIGRIEYSKRYSTQNSELLILTGAKFFFRSNDTIGFFLTAYYDGKETKIDAGRIGGGSGLLNIRWGAGNKIENEMKDGIAKLAQNVGAFVSSDTQP